MVLEKPKTVVMVVTGSRWSFAWLKLYRFSLGWFVVLLITVYIQSESDCCCGKLDNVDHMVMYKSHSVTSYKMASFCLFSKCKKMPKHAFCSNFEYQLGVLL